MDRGFWMANQFCETIEYHQSSQAYDVKLILLSQNRSKEKDLPVPAPINLLPTIVDSMDSADIVGHDNNEMEGLYSSIVSLFSESDSNRLEQSLSLQDISTSHTNKQKGTHSRQGNFKQQAKPKATVRKSTRYSNTRHRRRT
jgi:hypothetical protein